MKDLLYHIGAEINLVRGPHGLYDGTTSTTGVIIGFTKDDGVPTFRVRFKDGAVEEWLYKDEFELTGKIGKE